MPPREVVPRDLLPCMQLIDAVSGTVFAWNCQDPEKIRVFPDVPTFLALGEPIGEFIAPPENPVTRMPRWPDFMALAMGYLRSKR